MINLKQFILTLPKAELHVHIEGTLEYAQYREFAIRNNVAHIDAPHHCTDYDSFISAYIEMTKVIQTEQDFYELTMAYLAKAAAQNVLHTEIFFDIQTYVPRGISPATVINGIHTAIRDAEKKYGISALMIMCFIRHLGPDDAQKALELSLPFKDKIIGVGLASTEQGFPAPLFAKVFEKARGYGYRTVAHTEGNAAAVRQTLDALHVERIDHGFGCAEDPELMARIARENVALTICPLSNLMLGLVDDLEKHPLKKLLDAGLMVSINSDDPAFFDGYIAENYFAAATKMALTTDDIITCARNSFLSSFASEERKRHCLQKLADYLAQQTNC